MSMRAMTMTKATEHADPDPVRASCGANRFLCLKVVA